jgi:hypothetical protein
MKRIGADGVHGKTDLGDVTTKIEEKMLRMILRITITNRK